MTCVWFLIHDSIGVIHDPGCDVQDACVGHDSGAGSAHMVMSGHGDDEDDL